MMPSRQYVMLEPTKQNIKWAMGQLERFSDRRGYPAKEHPVAFQAQATAFLRIVHNKKVSEIIGKPHPDIAGDPNDAEWLIGEALDQFEFYPQPVQLRRIYCEFLPAADGKEPPLERE